MVAEPPTREELRVIFQMLLNQALTRGRAPSGYSVLGPGTRAAIEAVAREHPDAEAECIAAAYDAFQLEHGEAR
jgi:hypothetical protein